MWANRAWVGVHYPGATKPGTELRAYVSWCDAVEGNTTFYATPTESVSASWAAQVPPGFRFVNKLPRAVTHDRRLRHVDDELSLFLQSMEPLQGLLGPLAVQLPASFEPDDLPTLLRFLDTTSRDFSWAVEVRHPDFFGGHPAERALNDALHKRDMDRIILDSRAVFAGPRETPEEIDAFEKKPRLEVRPVATGSQPVIRFIGQRSLDENRPYWQKWIPSIVRWLRDGRSPIVFLHTPDNLDAPVMARQFYAAVRDELPELPDLPEPLRPDGQDPLFLQPDG
jgi:uncharacterized protein YecE (DUF72 family)